MSDFEILHLSDLHWSENSRPDRMIVIDALLADLRRLMDRDVIKPDFVVFSGDLALSGEEPSQFDATLQMFLEPVLSAVGLGRESLFLAPGNHDISRAAVRQAQFVEKGLLSTLRSVDEVNRFLDTLATGDAAALMGVERTRAFYDFIDKEFPADNKGHPLLRCYKREKSGLSIGIACFDTAWRATGERDDLDRNSLLIGERNIDHAVDCLKDTDIRLAVMHHPLDWLADFDEFAVSSRLSAQFDVVFCGHTHRGLPQTRTTAQGTAILSQAGSIYANRRWFNGYQSVQLNAADGECTFIVRTFMDTPRREFDEAVNVAPGGKISFPYRCSERSGGMHMVESFLRHARQMIRQSAAEHMNMIGATGREVEDIKEAFVAPPLSRKSIYSADEDAAQAHERYEEISPETILRSEQNHLITGNRETGKTSLLHYLAVLCAEGASDRPRIPVILSGPNLKPNLYNLKRAIGTYLGPPPRGFDVDSALNDGLFLFLIDDVSGPDGLTSALKENINKFPKSRWICITSPRVGTITGQSDQADELNDFRDIRIGMLPRRSIRALTRRWSPAIGQNDDEIFEAVMKQIKRDALPRTGYIVTLLLWAMQQEKELERVNEAILLSNVVDYLLGRADFTQSVVGKFDPRAKEITLEHLASFFKDRSGVSTVNEATTFLVELFRSARLPFVAVDVLAELVACGILERSDDTVAFKYPCFQEYFFACKLRADPTVLAEIMSNGRYIESDREIELLAGLRRQNTDILNIIVSDIDKRTPRKIAKIQSSEFDELTDLNLEISVTQKKLSELRNKRFSSDQVDDLMDAAERRVTRRVTEAKSSTSGIDGDRKDLFGENVDERKELSVRPMGLVEYLSATDLLARVIRNSDFTEFSVKGPATKLVLKSMVKICLLIRKEIVSLLDETISKSGEYSLSEEDRKSLTYLINKMVVTVSALTAVDLLASPNIIPMAEEILLEPELSVAERIYLCFLLQGCRANGWHTHFSDLLKEKGNSGFVVECVIERIQGIVNTQYLDERENEKLHSVIDTVEEVLNWGTGIKGQVISNLKKAALQADIRDDRV